MIYYVTNQPLKTIFSKEITPITESDFYSFHLKRLDELVSINEYLGVDTETNGLDPYLSEILLTSFGGASMQYVAHCSVDYIRLFKYLSNYPIIGANLKFDHKIIKAKTGVDLGLKHPLYDVMIVEQRLFKGLEPIDPITQQKLPFYGLDVLAKRHLNVTLNDFSNSFAGISSKNFIPTNNQIQYSAYDIRYLNDIRRKQAVYVSNYKLDYAINVIENPLIRILSNAENRGVVLDIEAVHALEKQNEKEAYDIACQLDDEVRLLRDTLLDDKEALFLKGGKYDLNRKQITISQSSLFDDIEAKETIYNSAKSINYKSTPEVVYILGRLKQRVPTKNGTTASIIFNHKGKLANSYEDFTTDKKIIGQYLIENPDIPIKRFLELLSEYREIKDNISKYGEKFIKKINPVTGRLHTIYRQCRAENNRLQSGGGKQESDKFQSQNVPAKPEYRKLFRGAEGSKIITIDLSGAEAIIMADKANDTKLFELAIKGDIHSHMATAGWRNIFRRRGEFEKADSFVVTKTNENKEYRVKGKNATFGSIYGMGGKKAGKTLNVSPAEGTIYINTIKSIIPKTFAMIERNIKFALTNGYIIFNTKTNSRYWFRDVNIAFKEQRDLTWEEQENIRGQASNLPISGTQADMIKEAMVVIDQKIRERGLENEIFLLLQVHDELVYEVLNAEKAQEYGEFLRDTLVEVANTYLKNIKITSSLEIHDTWIK